MVNNILIFRTDRIGDLLYTCPALLTIKNNLSNAQITLIASKKNFACAKSLQIFDKVDLFPQKNLLSKIKFIYHLSKLKFDYIFIFDGKNRSIISSIFIKSRYKVAIITEKKLNRIWNFFKIKFINNKKENLINLFQESLNHCQINKKITNFDFLKNKNDNRFNSRIKIKNYLHIHLDEKWFTNLYIKTYTEINPSYDDMADFINQLSKNYDILITTGLVDFQLIDNLKNKFFIRETDNIYYKKNLDKFIYFVYKPTFDDLISILNNAQILISCHGAITHAANSFDIQIIDIIDENKKSWYSRYTYYLRNYKPIYRSKFSKIQKNLISQLSH